MSYCFLCDGTGRYHQPIDKDNGEEIIQELSRAKNSDPDELRKKAMRNNGYIEIECPNCNGGHSSK